MEFSFARVLGGFGVFHYLCRAFPGLPEVLLRGLFVGSTREASLCYIDNANLPSEDEKDIIVADEVFRAFEETSNTILNRNVKQ